MIPELLDRLGIIRFEGACPALSLADEGRSHRSDGRFRGDRVHASQARRIRICIFAFFMLQLDSILFSFAGPAEDWPTTWSIPLAGIDSKHPARPKEGKARQ